MTALEVSVKLSGGRTVRVPVTRGTKISTLCEKVAEEENVAAEIVTLKFDGKVLKRNKTMNDYGVMEQMVLKVKFLTKQQLQLHLNLPKKEVVSFEIHNTSQLSVISEKLLDAKPELRNNYQLTFHIGQMQLQLSNYAYEDCIQDGEQVLVKAKQIGGEEEIELEEEERQEVLNSFASSMTSQREVDVVFSFDTTGSMYSLLDTIKQRLRDSATRLLADIPNINIGFIAHGDYCDEYSYVLRKQDLSGSVDELVSFVDGTPRSGGEGSFACYEWVLRHANGFSWRGDAAKALVIIGDVVPHPTSYTNMAINWREELEALCEKGVKVYGVQARNHRPANSFYGYMARRSGGAHIKFQHFSLITDMFFAVCYRESGDDQLQAYVDEVRNEGRMTEEMMDVMKQFEKKDEEEEEEEKKEEEEEGKDENQSSGASANAEPSPSRPREPQEEEYVQDAWWDATLDHPDQTVYTLSEDTNTWRRTAIVYQNASNRSMSLRKSKRGLSKKGCTLM